MGNLLRTLAAEENGFRGSTDLGDEVHLELMGADSLLFDSVFDGVRPISDNAKYKKWLYKQACKKLKNELMERFYFRISKIRVERHEQDSSAIITYLLFKEKEPDY